MSNNFSERRLAENEVFFRQLNERVEKSFQKLKVIAKKDNDDMWLANEATPVHFYCECADEKCRERIIVTQSAYKRAHENERDFIIIRGHEALEIERVLKDCGDYLIVRKNSIPPVKATKLNPTALQN